MSAADTWMPLYIGDYLADTMRLTTVQHGAYLLMLMEYWRQGPLPDDETELAAICRMDVKSWKRDVERAVMRYFVVQSDGLLHQKRCDDERERADQLSQKRRDAANTRYTKRTSAASNGGTERKETPCKQDANAPAKAHANAGAIAEPNALQLDTHARTCASASPSQSQREEKKGGVVKVSTDLPRGNVTASTPPSRFPDAVRAQAMNPRRVEQLRAAGLDPFGELLH